MRITWSAGHEALKVSVSQYDEKRWPPAASVYTPHDNSHYNGPRLTNTGDIHLERGGGGCQCICPTDLDRPLWYRSPFSSTFTTSAGDSIAFNHLCNFVTMFVNLLASVTLWTLRYWDRISLCLSVRLSLSLLVCTSVTRMSRAYQHPPRDGSPIWCCCKKISANILAAVSPRKRYEKSRYSTNISLYLLNDTKYGHSYEWRRLGTRIRSAEWWNVQWLRVTTNASFKVIVFFNVK